MLLAGGLVKSVNNEQVDNHMKDRQTLAPIKPSDNIAVIHAQAEHRQDLGLDFIRDRSLVLLHKLRHGECASEFSPSDDQVRELAEMEHSRWVW